MTSIWFAAYNRDGFGGLYQGLEAQVFKGFLSQGLSMMTKQRYDYTDRLSEMIHVVYKPPV